MTRRAITTTSREEDARQSPAFFAYLEETLTQAQRRRDDRSQDISTKTLAVERAFSDYQAFKLATEAEIAELKVLIADDDGIINVATMALRKPMVQHHEVQTELEGEQ